MNPNNVLASLISNGGSNMNPKEIMKMMGLGDISMDKIKDNVINDMSDKVIGILYKEFPESDRKELFYDDPRRSEKEKSITALITKAAPLFIKKLNSRDIDLIFDKIQKYKD